MVIFKVRLPSQVNNTEFAFFFGLQYGHNRFFDMGCFYFAGCDLGFGNGHHSNHE